MRALAQRGCAQALLPPQDRPNFRLLRSLGFTGSDADVLAKAYKEAPVILACAYSASPMWTANAATVSPSADTGDGRVHFTPANLNNKLHRAFEHTQSARSLRAIFNNPHYFAVHDALPRTAAQRWKCSSTAGWSSTQPRLRPRATRRARRWKPRRRWPVCTNWMPGAPSTWRRIRA
jgi:succinylarginine dihydrolase